MGAAPYGDPVHAEKILDELVDLRDDGSFKLNMKYFAYDYGLTMTNDRFAKLFGHPVREMEGEMEPFHWDMAASVQKVTEEIVLRMVRDLHARAGTKNHWQRVNLKIKFRESFRPFAPACLAEKASEWFDIDRESPYMLLVCQVREGRDIPAVTHVDGSARLQTVTRESHAEFYDLLARSSIAGRAARC
jgi:predicted NodU family carbamoyl transferase